MDHPSDDVLNRYALDPALVASAPEIEHHLASCQHCRSELDRIREFDARLAERDAWEGLADPLSQRSELGAFANRLAAEEQDARRLLAPFENAPAATLVWANLPNKSAFRTSGVVRLLNRHANAMCDRDPRHALAIAQTAVAIASLLSETDYPAVAIHEWRGESSKEVANALYSLGELPDAHKALDRAEAEYNKIPHAGIGAVAVAYVRALVLYEQEAYDDAAHLADRAARAARHLGADDRYMAARTLRGNIAFRRSQLREAASIFGNALSYGEALKNDVWIARESLNIGLCHLELGEHTLARHKLETAQARFNALHFDAELARTKWALARLSFAEGSTREGVIAMKEAINNLTRLGMLGDAAIASVHLAEMFAALRRPREGARVLTGITGTFTRAGKLTGALAALAYLKEAALAGELTPERAGYVRTYLRRVERRPQLVFLPPPSD